jgi:8-oxo-dGTP pyrophosphatase MutT (NUDIX family)
MAREPSIGLAMDNLAPGEELNPDSPTVPRQAASVIVLRGGATALEVLLLQRTPHARFMGGAWVFPGGAVDRSDIGGGERDAAASRLAGATALRRAALREVEEEAGLVLPPDAPLIPFSRWITPPEVRIRFDAYFFLAPLPDGAEARHDGDEMVAHGWYTPAGALDAHRAGELELVFPTIKHLEQLSGFGSADEVLRWATGRTVVAVEPRVRVSGETARVVLPGEPGYAD